MATGGSAFLEALVEARVSHIFANLGSDHGWLIEEIAKATALGHPLPRLITCPTEMVALSAAHGFAQVSGIAQAVVVHVECGTQSLAGAVHNVAKGRIPVLIFAGTSPFTQNGELKGSRNEFAQWLQDAFDQRGLIRGYTKYDNEIRTAANIREITHRALRIAYSDPKGPVYLMASREVMEESLGSGSERTTHWQPINVAALAAEAVDLITTDLIAARRPLIVTSYAGRNHGAVSELVKLSDRLGIGVLESVPTHVNFPHNHTSYQGSQWNEVQQNPLLSEADTILVIDSDVPWIPLLNKPDEHATIHHIDVDPLKLHMPLAAVSSRHAYQADTQTALRQINARLDLLNIHQDSVDERRAHYAQLHCRRVAALRDKEQSDRHLLTPEYLTACIRNQLDANTLVINEGVSNYQVITNHLNVEQPGGMFASGGSSLGWHGGAAVGAKLASPNKMIIALTGDGSYMMSDPSSVHWMARRYRTPFVQIIYNNGGWKSPKLSTLAIHPEGYSHRAKKLGVEFRHAPDYASIAAAAGRAFGRTVRHRSDVEGALQDALRAVRTQERAAVLDVHLAPL